MTSVSTANYIMEDPREALRLERKVDPETWTRRYLKRHLANDSRVLSVGCGPGTILRAVTSCDPSISATGLDVSPNRIAQARERNRNNPCVHFVCGDAQQMQFPSDTFDVVYARMLLEYLTDKERAVAEMVRVAKPGGVVLLQDLDGQLLWHYPEEPVLADTLRIVTGALAAHGFDPLVGRKLFALARQAGLRSIGVEVECYHLIAGEAEPEILAQWQTKLEIAQPCMARALGSSGKAEEAARRFIEYLERPDTLTYSNVFTITGEKPYESR